LGIYEDFQWRGLVYDGSEGIVVRLAERPITLYIGFDPTASSLHVGSLLQILNLARMQRFGHTPIALVGGGTGLIGDPSGKSQERQLLTAEKVKENMVGLREQLSRFLDFDSKTNPARMVDNGEWLTTIPLVDFLRDIGKYFKVNQMLAKDSVKLRLDKEEGISFTEFSYQLLQSYDFLVLYERYGCELQMGGSDQWGNITAGAELIRRVGIGKAYALVVPLVMSASGVKFGKTETGTVWLDAERTSPYRFYQYWLNADDRDVITYLKYFTYLNQEEVAGLEATHAEAPQKREAHRRLARLVTEMVHGKSALDRAERSSEVLFGAQIKDLKPAEILDIFQEVPSSEVSRDTFAGAGKPLVELLAESLGVSKGAARRLVREGGAYLNNQRCGDEAAQITSDDFLGGQVLVLRKGRKQYHVVKLMENAS
jgi:tyrosyl-tRNA synthetase